MDVLEQMGRWPWMYWPMTAGNGGPATGRTTKSIELVVIMLVWHAMVFKWKNRFWLVVQVPTTSKLAIFWFAAYLTWSFFKVADCCHIVIRYILTCVVLYQLNSWSLSYQLPSLYPQNLTVVVFCHRLIVDVVGPKILCHGSYYQKRSIKATLGRIYGSLILPDFPMLFWQGSRFLWLSHWYLVLSQKVKENWCPIEV